MGFGGLGPSIRGWGFRVRVGFKVRVLTQGSALVVTREPLCGSLNILPLQYLQNKGIMYPESAFDLLRPLHKVWLACSKFSSNVFQR